MTETVRTSLRWLSATDGGRAVPPACGRYATVAHFEEDPDWPRIGWTVVLELVAPEAQGTAVATLRFLVPEKAPVRLLHAGSRFELLEGSRVVAQGEVLA